MHCMRCFIYLSIYLFYFFCIIIQIIQVLYSYSVVSMVITFAILIIIGALLFDVIYRKPKQKYQTYIQLFQAQGYRVAKLPFNPFKITYLDHQKKDAEKYGNIIWSFIHVFNEYDVVISNAFTRPWISILNPNLIRQLCMNEKDFVYEKELMIIEPAKRTIGQGVLFSEGKIWEKKRKILNKVFKFDFIRDQHPMIIQRCKEALELIQNEKKVQNLGDNQKLVCFHNYGQYIAQTTILQSFMGDEGSKQLIDGKRISLFCVQTTDFYMRRILNDPLVLLFGKKFERLGLRACDREDLAKINKINVWIKDYVRNRIVDVEAKIRQLGDKFQGKDIFSAVIQDNYYKIKEGKADQAYTQQQLTDEFKTFLFAGTASTANTINAMMFLLVKHPQVEKKIREEIANVIGDREDFSFEDLKKCEYIQAVFKETLRLNGPLNFNVMRKTVNDHKLSGIPIFKGTVIHYASDSTHHCNAYFKQADQFRPERWLNGQCAQMNPFNYVVFNSGSRSCIGKHLATLQIKIGCIMLLLRYTHIKIEAEKLIFRVNASVASDPYNAIVTK